MCVSVSARVCACVSWARRFSTGSFDRFKVLTGTAGSACAHVRGASLKEGTLGRRGECVRGVSGTSRDRQGPEGSRKQWRLLEAAFTKVPGGLAWPSGVERGSRSGEHVRGSLSLATRATPAVAVCCRNAPGKHSGTGGAGAVRGLSGFGLILSCWGQEIRSGRRRTEDKKHSPGAGTVGRGAEGGWGPQGQRRRDLPPNRLRSSQGDAGPEHRALPRSPREPDAATG